jgi:hypothetical protein
MLDERTPMRRYLVIATVVALALPAAATAKGPASASITGPGVRTLAVSGNGEAPGNPLGTLANAGGFFAQMFGQTPDPTLRLRPKGALGPRYTVVYVVPGPNNTESRVTQFVYPYAKPVALTYMRPGQVFWGDQKAHGGWFRATAGLKRMLVNAGLPARMPT